MGYKERKTLLVMTCGNTPEPLKQAINNYVGHTKNLEVVLWYGRSLKGQENAKAGQRLTPLDVAVEIKECFKDTGIIVFPKEISEPEDFDVCLREFEKFFSTLIPDDYENLIINYTGGTKSMSAAIVHAGLKIGVQILNFIM